MGKSEDFSGNCGALSVSEDTGGLYAGQLWTFHPSRGVCPRLYLSSIRDETRSMLSDRPLCKIHPVSPKTDPTSFEIFKILELKEPLNLA